MAKMNATKIESSNSFETSILKTFPPAKRNLWGAKMVIQSPSTLIPSLKITSKQLHSTLKLNSRKKTYPPKIKTAVNHKRPLKMPMVSDLVFQKNRSNSVWLISDAPAPTPSGESMTQLRW